jgi:hypothetical protein
MNVFAALSKYADPVMAIQNRSIQTDLQRTLLTGSQRDL